MILTLDVGNTNIKTAVFDGEKLAAYWRISTSGTSTSDELGILLNSLFTHKGLRMADIDGVIFSSVVPPVNFTIEHMVSMYLGLETVHVSANMDLGITIRYDNPTELGTDRIANAVAAYTIYGGPCITIDFGTATTFGVVSEDGAFLGGAISPGIKLAAEALVSGAAKLPRVELVKPATVIGRNTVANIQSGLVFGFVGQINYIIRKIQDELGCRARVVATGGLATLIASESKAIDTLDGLLTLKGLRILYERGR
ncbi:MAG: type III pantothenate kinase [Oscillospiraceae bacterium]|jgi:type III pantothenate kinase|nr:type III pantothenate kinase [Oscillospiraceae bacterium]